MNRQRTYADFNEILIRLFKAIVFIGFIIVFVKLYTGWLDHGKTMMVDRIQIEGNDFFEQQEIISQTGLHIPALMSSLSLEDVQAKMETNPFLERVEIYKTYPNRLTLHITEKQPVALLNVNGKLLCIDREGMILPSRPGRLYQLPVISGEFEGEIAAGIKARGPRVNEGLQFLKLLIVTQSDLYDKISEIVVGHNKGILVYTCKAGIPVWFGVDDYHQKIQYFEAIYSELESKHGFNEVKYIDLRYDNQVVLGMRS